ncbi:DUF4817 domain-containing protein [Trichonephila clavipes]|nr:DUF4817 domain-containing protein [Trichonephila clavipes]
MVLKANDRRTSCPCHDEFRGPRSDYVRQDGNVLFSRYCSDVRRQGWSGIHVFYPISVSNMLGSRQQRIFAVGEYFSNCRSVIAVQRAFHRHFDIPPRGHVPDWKCVLMWINAFQRKCLERKERTSENH